MKRLIACAALLGLVGGAAVLADDKKTDEPSSPKAALQALNDFIGDWKGNGEPEGRDVDRRDGWKEEVSWGWRFKGDDAWLTMKVKHGKFWKSAQLRYLPK